MNGPCKQIGCGMCKLPDQTGRMSAMDECPRCGGPMGDEPWRSFCDGCWTDPLGLGYLHDLERDAP